MKKERYDFHSAFDDDDDENEGVQIMGDEFGEDADWDTEYNPDYGLED